MFRLTREVSISDVGQEKIMKLGSLLELMADCEQFQVDSDKYVTGYLKNNNIGIYLVARQLDILRLPRYGETVSCTTAITDLNPITGSRYTFAYGADGGVLAKSYVLGAFVSLETQKMAKVSREFLDDYTCGKKEDMELLPRKIETNESGFKPFPPFTVPRFYIDFYGHMNNVNYIIAASEYLPEGFCPSRIRIEYKIAAKKGDIIYPAVHSDGNVCVIRFTDESQKTVYSVAEFRK